MLNSRSRRLRYAAAGLALMVLAAHPARSETTISDLLPDDAQTTLSGSYLAAMSAARARDFDAATIFFEEALSQDPDNPLLLDRAFTLMLANGDVEAAFPIAERLVKATDSSRMGQLALGIQALKQKNYRESAERLSKGDRGELANVTAGLLSAWAAAGSGETDGAIKIVSTMQGPAWNDVFKNFNIALIADIGGRQGEALAAIEKAYKTDSSSMRVVEAYVRLQARAGNIDAAKRALAAYGQAGAGQPLIKALADEIAAGKKPAPMAANVAEGAAEVLYGLGSALGSEKGGDDIGLVYLRLALYLDPKSELALLALGDLLQNSQDFARSNSIFEQVPKASPLRRAADMQIAFNLDALGKKEDAIRHLKRLAASDPRDVEALTSLGTIYRGEKRYDEAAAMYGKALSVMGPDDPRNWLLHYFRGIAYERANDWPKAEVDFEKAMALAPNEPQVLNYLGYSWIDKGINIERGTELIKKAVSLKPDDGYIVDSLGWAYYKLGRYDEAVAQLERAITLRSDDVTINDHLGDAYWKVGRKLEATFQWAHARDLDPEPEVKERILAKLAHGLDKAEESQVAAVTGNTVTDATTSAAAAPLPTSVTVEPGDSLWKIATRVYGNGELYSRLIEANRAKFRDPDNIWPGTVIEIPALDAAP